jgi:hypothetical protein
MAQAIRPYVVDRLKYPWVQARDEAASCIASRVKATVDLLLSSAPSAPAAATVTDNWASASPHGENPAALPQGQLHDTSTRVSQRYM